MGDDREASFSATTSLLHLSALEHGDSSRRSGLVGPSQMIAISRRVGNLNEQRAWRDAVKASIEKRCKGPIAFAQDGMHVDPCRHVPDEQPEHRRG